MLPIFFAQILLVCGREADSGPIYSIDQPDGWVARGTEGSLEDTKKPLVSLEKGSVVVTLHNFPLGSSEGIPPGAQVSRWIGQLDGWEGNVVPTSQGGFVGLIVEGSGQKVGEPIGLIAAAFQLADGAKRELRYEALIAPSSRANQRLADVTIKANGPSAEINPIQEEIYTIIHSLQLIDPIP